MGVQLTSMLVLERAAAVTLFGATVWVSSQSESRSDRNWRKALSSVYNALYPILRYSNSAKEIKVESGWSDFVFEDNYELPSLNSVESYIKKNKHLPDVPSAKEVVQTGLAVSEMLAKQMQKIEEMTLYLIQLKKENDLLRKIVAGQDKQLASLKELQARIEALEQRNYVAIRPIARSN